MEKCKYEQLFAEKVATLCCDHYKNNVKKTGKPQTDKEWTFLASVIAELPSKDGQEDLRVVALGTGSKCLGQNKLNNTGNLIHDSHAEVIARRAFIRFLYRELHQVHQNDTSDYIERDPECKAMFKIKSEVSFHFFTSDTPCGDAAIFQLTEDVIPCNLSDLIGQSVMPSGTIQHENGSHHKRKLSQIEEDEGRPVKSALQDSCIHHQLQKDLGHKISDSRYVCHQPGNVSSTQRAVCENKHGAAKKCPLKDDAKASCTDTHRTGAKCASEERQDPLLSGCLYHVTGVLRTKPGRGDRTLSMSCSDKLALWNVLGVQGALITILIKTPIYLKTITLGRCACSMDAVKRAVLERTKSLNELSAPYHHHNTIILQANNKAFEHCREVIEHNSPQQKTGPSPASVIWWLDGIDGRQEASVNGRRQGVVSKNWDKPVARCCICPCEFLRQFILLTKHMTKEEKEHLNISPSSETYLDYKSCAIGYQQAKKTLLKLFSNWLITPRKYYQFTLND